MRRRKFITLLGGAAAAWPIAARAQQQTGGMKRMAVVHPIVSTEIMNGKSEIPFYRGLFNELQSLGYIEGNNLIVERRSGEGKTERYAEIARELVNLKPDVMVVTSARILAYFREATRSRTQETQFFLGSFLTYPDQKETSQALVRMRASKSMASIWRF